MLGCLGSYGIGYLPRFVSYTIILQSGTHIEFMPISFAPLYENQLWFTYLLFYWRGEIDVLIIVPSALLGGPCCESSAKTWTAGSDESVFLLLLSKLELFQNQ